MGPEHWRKIEQLYYSALKLDESQRTAFLEQACGGDNTLRTELQSLLAHGRRDSLEAPAMEWAARALHEETGSRSIPAAIGRYRAIRLLGEGGMGVVYEAEQDQPRRTVALKVIKPGFASPETISRFQHEFEALGRLQHPGIAQIYEAGMADTGFGPQPYFAMELIRGLPLLDYTEAHRLNLQARLSLMAKVCDAVEHAHQRGVIHRDLKPSNMLVDEGGQPKVLDFGVARVTDRDAHVTQTDLGQIVGTLAYMSPEQVVGDPAALDTRSDVYAMGVILYELLAGKLPYEIDRKPLPDAVSAIREAEPAHLSAIDRSYRGDIETIVAKALEKDKARRYGSAAELAADIRRYLADEPITARPASATYQLQKFARRHRALVAGSAAVVAVLAVGLVASTWEAGRARKAESLAVQQRDRATAAERLATAQRDLAIAADARAQQERNGALAEKRRADDEAATAQAINDFLQNGLLAQASSNTQAGLGRKPDPDLKVRTTLDRAAELIKGKFDKQPKVEAAVRYTIGSTYADIGLYAQAQTQLERALTLQRRTLGTDDPATLRTATRLGRTAVLQGRFDDAEKILARAVETQRRVLGGEHPDTLASMHNLAIAYYKHDKNALAVPLFHQTIEVRRRVLGPEHPDTLASMNSLANTYGAQHKDAEAKALHREVLEVRRRTLGPEHPDTLASMNNLGVMCNQMGDFAESEELFSQAREILRRVLGPEHPDTLAAGLTLALTYLDDGRYAQAEGLYNQILEIQRHVLGTEHPDTLASMRYLGLAYREQGKYEEAEALCNRLLEARRRLLGPDKPQTLEILTDLATIHAAYADYSRAEALFRDSEGLSRIAGGNSGRALVRLAEIAQMYQREGKYALAESYAAQSLAIVRKIAGPNYKPEIWIAEKLVLASVSQGKFTESEMLAREVVARYREKWPDSDEWQRFLGQSLLGASLAGQKRYAEAEPALLAGYQGMLVRKDRIAMRDRYDLDRAREWLVQLYRAWGKPEKAVEFADAQPNQAAK